MASPDKVAAVAEIKQKFENSNGAVVTAYTGLTVAQIKDLRRALGEDAQYRVSKNTLTKIAANEAGIAELDEHLTGSTAVAFLTGDPVTAAKGLRNFAKENPALVIKGGVLDGKALSADEINKLAELESREVLLAKLAGGMKASMAKAAATFQAPLTKLVRTADALRDKVEQGGGASAAPAEAE
ncbi:MULTISPECIES: 50S ribosomal protein L10 [Streptomyces]|uniref:Large ribosomal subunit protein uL10 n=3 Tax=Streptomyces TaxID=1883 RepID=A0A7X6D0D5_9ACTN|nr:MULTISPECIES: 50S ribosomal protein L10 [Streptomyces]NJP66475.1 50S ribosomal protein L10 [Streptomyces spiramenti]NJQ05883.1 50S ribosomal protein L10 [Streptomyces lonarensis]NJQ14476.1 50S ribosomal protein L10 [Streptomyces bohaiensis]